MTTKIPRSYHTHLLSKPTGTLRTSSLALQSEPRPLYAHLLSKRAGTFLTSSPALKSEPVLECFAMALPPELWTIVLGYLPKALVARIALVNQFFCSLARKVLYRDVIVGSHHPIYTEQLSGIIENPSLAGNVQTLWIHNFPLLETPSYDSVLHHEAGLRYFRWSRLLRSVRNLLLAPYLTRSVRDEAYVVLPLLLNVHSLLLTMSGCAPDLLFPPDLALLWPGSMRPDEAPPVPVHLASVTAQVSAFPKKPAPALPAEPARRVSFRSLAVKLRLDQLALLAECMQEAPTGALATLQDLSLQIEPVHPTLRSTVGTDGTAAHTPLRTIFALVQASLTSLALSLTGTAAPVSGSAVDPELVDNVALHTLMACGGLECVQLPRLKMLTLAVLARAGPAEQRLTGADIDAIQLLMVNHAASLTRLVLSKIPMVVDAPESMDRLDKFWAPAGSELPPPKLTHLTVIGHDRAVDYAAYVNKQSVFRSRMLTDLSCFANSLTSLCVHGRPGFDVAAIKRLVKSLQRQDGTTLLRQLRLPVARLKIGIVDMLSVEMRNLEKLGLAYLPDEELEGKPHLLDERDGFWEELRKRRRMGTYARWQLREVDMIWVSRQPLETWELRRDWYMMKLMKKCIPSVVTLGPLKWWAGDISELRATHPSFVY